MKINSDKITFSIPLEDPKANTKMTIECAKKSARDLIGMPVNYCSDLKYNITSVDVKDGYIWIEAERKWGNEIE